MHGEVAWSNLHPWFSTSTLLRPPLVALGCPRVVQRLVRPHFPPQGAESKFQCRAFTEWNAQRGTHNRVTLKPTETLWTFGATNGEMGKIGVFWQTNPKWNSLQCDFHTDMWPALHQPNDRRKPLCLPAEGSEGMMGAWQNWHSCDVDTCWS